MAVAARPSAEDPRLAHPAATRGRAATPWVVGAIVLLGALLRFTTVGEQSFWYDEAVTWGIVAHGLGHVLSTVPKSESTPPLYYVVLWLWTRIFGLGDAGLRSFSALCSTLTIPVVWLIGRRLVSNRVGLVAALLTAVNPFLFWYAQEARSYSMLLLMSALSLLALVHALALPTRRRVLVWGLVSAVALATHYYAAVSIVPEAAWLALALDRRGELTWDRIAAGLTPVVIVGGALTPLMIHQNDGRAGYIVTKGGSLPFRLAQLVKEDIIGEGQPIKALLTAIGCLAVASALALLATRATRRERSAALVALFVGAGGVAVAVVVAVIGTDYINTRNLIPTWPALMLIVAVGLGAARAARIGAISAGVLVVLSLFCISNVIANPDYQRPNWRGAAAALGATTQPRVIVADIQSEIPLTPYLRGLSSYLGGGGAVSEVDLIWVQRNESWGPLAPISPATLPGFPRMTVIRTRSYVVVRYRALRPTAESLTELNHLYPLADRALTLLQRP